MCAGHGKLLKGYGRMPAKKTEHAVNLSSLPRTLLPSTKAAKSLPVSWDKTALRERVVYVMQLLCGRESAVNIQFLNPSDMAALNWQFRGKTESTDVLSFLPHESNLTVENVTSKGAAHHFNMGDVAVCADVCAEQARRHRCTLSEEIERMVVHGIVHLLGLDHERSPAAHKVMTDLEKSIRRELRMEFGAADFCRAQERSSKAARAESRR